MVGVNKVILLGNLGKDPEIRYLEGGIAVAKISLATAENYKDKTTGDRRTITEWHKVVLWRELAEFTEKYVKKGSLVFIEGKIRSRQWQNKDGNTKYSTEIIADNIQLIGRKEDIPDNSIGQSPSKQVPNIEHDNNMKDDLPF